MGLRDLARAYLESVNQSRHSGNCPVSGRLVVSVPDKAHFLHIKHAVNPVRTGNAIRTVVKHDHADSSDGPDTSDILSDPDTYFHLNYSELRAKTGYRYRVSGVACPPTPSVLADDLGALAGCLFAAGVRLSVERGMLTWWADQSPPKGIRHQIGVHRVRLADEIGNWSVEGSVADEPDFGDTSRWCEHCGQIAPLADFSPLHRDEGRWLCEPCFEETDHPNRPERRRRSLARPVDTTSTELTRVPIPHEPARPDWWQQPVSGWPDGKLIIANVADHEAIEIDLGGDE